ncbi:hypothetical protein [Spirosoma validum]|uniref:Uncharacterized protein n=1 Tax=Spirosoma validum TaxID=2771355 RepID=A0A927B8E1_9BACT|nr:hypothetical protein [Spirosoma validum]MBD2757168.1 hypothetical protein [Spirosoma validum]
MSPLLINNHPQNHQTNQSTNPNAAIIPGPKRELLVSIDLSTNNSYGQSSIALVHEALVAHRYSLISCFFEELRAGSYENAYVYWKNVEEINDLIDQMLRETALVSINNYYADESTSNPGGYSNWMDHLPKDKEGRFKTFLEMVKPETPIE